MKKTILAVLLSFCGLAQATVLTFEDQPGDTITPLANGYGGFNWNSAATVGSITKDYHPGTGYQAGTIGNISVYNWYGSSPTNIDLAGSGMFTFNGAQFTSAWSDQTLTFFGYNDGNLIYTSNAYSVTTQTPLWIELDWSGIDRLQIVNTADQWDMDNFTFNENAVPEPGSLLLLGLGLTALAATRRRRF